MDIFILPLLGLAAYLLGSISFAIVLAKLLNLEDPRTVGSNNPGATNMLRVSGFKIAFITFFCDALKAVIPVVLARLCGLDLAEVALVGLLAFLGHLYPVFFEFKGGKGVAPAIGFIWAFSPFCASLLTLTWFIVYFTTKYVSLSGIIAFSLLPFLIMMLYGITVASIFFVVSILLVYSHRDNIIRLHNGREDKTELFSK